MGRLGAGYYLGLLRLFLGIFFIILGIAGITNTSESVFAIHHTNIKNIEVIFGVLELICGLLIFLGFFSFFARQYTFISGIIILILWIIRIIMSKFVWNFPSTNSSLHTIIDWLLILSAELVIGAVILALIRRND